MIAYKLVAARPGDQDMIHIVERQGRRLDVAAPDFLRPFEDALNRLPSKS